MKIAIPLVLLVACLFPTVGLAAFADFNFVEVAPGNYEVRARLHPRNGDVIGIAGFAFDVIGVDSESVSFEIGKLYAVDPNTFQQRGFLSSLQGPVGDYYSVGAIQATADGTTEFMGLGIEPVVIAGFPPTGIDVGAPALLGSLTAPAGLTYENFSNVSLSAFPADYAGISQGATMAIDEIYVAQLVTHIPEPGTLALTTSLLLLTLGGVKARAQRV